MSLNIEWQGLDWARPLIASLYNRSTRAFYFDPDEPLEMPVVPWYEGRLRSSWQGLDS